MWLGILGQSGCHLSTPALANSARKMTPLSRALPTGRQGPFAGENTGAAPHRIPTAAVLGESVLPVPGLSPAPQRPSDPITPSSPARASASSVVQRHRLTTDSAASPPLSARCSRLRGGGGAKPPAGQPVAAQRISQHQPVANARMIPLRALWPRVSIRKLGG